MRRLTYALRDDVLEKRRGHGKIQTALRLSSLAGAYSLIYGMGQVKFHTAVTTGATLLQLLRVQISKSRHGNSHGAGHLQRGGAELA